MGVCSSASSPPPLPPPLRDVAAVVAAPPTAPTTIALPTAPPSPPLRRGDDAALALGGAASADAAGTGGGEPWPDEPLALHVLLVDDQAASRQLGAALLRDIGCTVELLDDGDEVEAALAQPRAVPIDAIVLDIVMVRSDGGEVCRTLRERLGCQLPIVACSAYVSHRSLAGFFRQGFDVVIKKPLTSSSLAQALLEARARRSAQARTRAPEADDFSLA